MIFIETEQKQIEKRTDLEVGSTSSGVGSTSSVTITKSVTTSSCTSSTQKNFKSGGGVARSGSDIKDMLIRWSRAKTKEYENVNIENFSGSWADGLAFAALIHHFFPDAYDFKELDSKNRRRNFELAFKTAEERADIYPLIDPEDMVAMKDKPDWKCVFTYVQSIYRKLYDKP
ncbi:smoothelin-like protein 1 [Oppia nitens]|uniref:smoothelin-like protein 1 n=1 Tax=Oppia nitens TaxID=1686743 RepID=UPI0023DAA47E|nr:smoothelin-like protein 1 [Oppia nitens]